MEAMCHEFFDDLRVKEFELQSGAPLPPLFDFTKTELAVRPDLVHKLRPKSRCSPGFPPK
ncbi:regulator of ime2 [Coelomomyces lativittatus]|nr:regulator of ime2 [Coelomomyces lativittatus]